MIFFHFFWRKTIQINPQKSASHCFDENLAKFNFKVRNTTILGLKSQRIIASWQSRKIKKQISKSKNTDQKSKISTRKGYKYYEILTTATPPQDDLNVLNSLSSKKAVDSNRFGFSGNECPDWGVQKGKLKLKKHSKSGENESKND